MLRDVSLMHIFAGCVGMRRLHVRSLGDEFDLHEVRLRLGPCMHACLGFALNECVYRLACLFACPTRSRIGEGFRPLARAPKVQGPAMRIRIGVTPLARAPQVQGPAMRRRIAGEGDTMTGARPKGE